MERSNVDHVVESALLPTIELLVEKCRSNNCSVFLTVKPNEGPYQAFVDIRDDEEARSKIAKLLMLNKSPSIEDFFLKIVAEAREHGHSFDWLQSMGIPKQPIKKIPLSIDD